MKYTVLLITVAFRILGWLLMIANGWWPVAIGSFLALGLTGPVYLRSHGSTGPWVRLFIEVVTFFLVTYFGYYSIEWVAPYFRIWIAGVAAGIYLLATFSSFFGVRGQVVWPECH